MTAERLATLRERAKAYRSRPIASNEAQHVANMELAADAAESLPEALDEIERLRRAVAERDQIRAEQTTALDMVIEALDTSRHPADMAGVRSLVRGVRRRFPREYLDG